MIYIKRFIAVMLVLAVSWPYVWAFEVVASSATQRELSEIEGEIRELEDQIEEENVLLHNLRQELQDLRDAMYELDTQIGRLLYAIDETENAIALLSYSIAVVGMERLAAEIALDYARIAREEGQEVLAARVRAMHESGQINILDVLFNASSITDFLVRLEDLRAVIRFNRDLIERLENYEKEYQRSNEELFLLEARLQDLQSSYERQHGELEWNLGRLYLQVAEKHAFLNELEENEDRFELLLELLEKEHYALLQRGAIVQARFDRERAAAAFNHTTRRVTAPIVVQPFAPVSPVSPGSSGFVHGGQVHGAVAAPVGALDPTIASLGITLETHSAIVERMRGFQTPVTRFDGVFLWPVPGISYVAAGFGQVIAARGPRDFPHDGIDIMANSGHRIVAADSGVVSFVGWTSSLGLTVIIDHENGYRTVYGHNLRNLVAEGDRVTRGQHIADVGQTGPTLFDHLHFEILHNGRHVDPMRYFR